MASRSRKASRKTILVPRLSWTRRELCRANDISIATYKRLQAEGKGPKEIRFSERVVRIAPADAEKWLRTLAAANDGDAG